VRIAASHFLWKMVRKLMSYFVEVGRGNVAPSDITSRLNARAENWQPTAPPSGLFLEAIVYPRETFDRPLMPIVPVESRR
jgi:tRNA pseudouridine38-40 synthase